MRALAEVQTDSVGGGLQFVGYTGSNGWDNFLSEIMGGMGNGGQITSGSYFSAGPSSSEPSSSSGGYGSQIVDPRSCLIQASAAAIGAGVAAGYLTKNPVGAIAAAGIGLYAGVKFLPACQPKTNK